MTRLRAKNAFTRVFDALWRFGAASLSRKIHLEIGTLVGSKLHRSEAR
jgi:hypothetical protein